MATRVCKNIVRSLLREKMKELKAPSSEPYHQVDYLKQTKQQRKKDKY